MTKLRANVAGVPIPPARTQNAMTWVLAFWMARQDTGLRKTTLPPTAAPVEEPASHRVQHGKATNTSSGTREQVPCCWKSGRIQGNNEGSTPANQWVRVASWNVTDPLWLTPPSNHQETLRIDGVNDNLEWKWLSLRPIGATDTGTGTGGGGGGGGGGTGGVSTTYDTWPSSTILSNNLLSDYIAVQTFGFRG